MISTKYRSDATELMDDFNMEGEILRDALDKIANINRLLGGNRVTLEGVKSLIKNKPKQEIIRITDIGCGSGDMLRALADYGKKHQLNFLLKGVDANRFTIDYAIKLSGDYENITYQCKDIFNDDNEECDIMLCTLTLHHFKDGDILAFLQNYMRLAKVGIVINDLNRNKMAYYLFKALCFVFKLNDMSREDGLVSILRGFRKADLLAYSKVIKPKFFSIKWKWAFRYQWLIKTK